MFKNTKYLDDILIYTHLFLIFQNTERRTTKRTNLIKL